MKNDRSIRTAAKATGLIAALITVTAAPDADAQVLARFALRLEGGAGMMISEHQRTTLGFDGVAIQGSARLAVSLVDALAIQVGVARMSWSSASGHAGSKAMSCANKRGGTVTITCVSQRQPSANSGRIGRSIRRDVSVSFSVGPRSRLK